MCGLSYTGRKLILTKFVLEFIPAPNSPTTLTRLAYILSDFWRLTILYYSPFLRMRVITFRTRSQAVARIADLPAHMLGSMVGYPIATDSLQLQLPTILYSNQRLFRLFSRYGALSVHSEKNSGFLRPNRKWLFLRLCLGYWRITITRI